jgi:hypothetical protein
MYRKVEWIGAQFTKIELVNFQMVARNSQIQIAARSSCPPERMPRCDMIIHI